MAHLFEYLVISNIIAFLAFAVDKVIACWKLNVSRIPEQTLFGLMMLGPFGALAGMVLCAHKTRKWAFWIRVVACLALHLYLSIEVINKKYELIMKGSIDGLETQLPPMNGINDDVYDGSNLEHSEL